MKTEKRYMEDKKTHKFQKNGQKNRPSAITKLRHDTMFDLDYLQ